MKRSMDLFGLVVSSVRDSIIATLAFALERELVEAGQ